MKISVICLSLAFIYNVHAEMRVWTMEDGKTVEAEFVARLGGNVSLKNLKGKTFKIPENKFSEADLSYIQLQMPPTLKLDFSKTTEQRVFPDSLSDLPRSLYFDFKVKISQTSSQPYNHDLFAEFFVYADEIDGDKRILLDYQKESFRMTEGSKSVFEMTGKRAELLDYLIAGQRRGEEFGGYLIIVTDTRGEVVAYAGNEKVYEKVVNLRKVPIGKHFDDDCNRCFPTSPKRFY